MSGFMDDALGIDSPAPLDTKGTADQQYQYNLQALMDSLKYGAIGQSGPFGSTTYTKDANGVPTGQTTTLSPEMQSYYDQLFGQAGTATGGVKSLMGLLSGGLDLSGVGDTSGIAKSSYDRQVQMLKPKLDEARTQLDVNMSNRGLPVGSEVWNREQDRYDTAKNTALTQAARTADLDATTEQQRQIQNLISKFQANTGTMSAMNSATPNLTGQTPTAISTPWMQAAAPDYMGLTQAKYAADQAKSASDTSSAMSGISSAAGALMMFSDENMKERRTPASGEHILAMFRDMPVDDYRYRDEAQREFGLPEHRTGTMAQDYEEHFPEGSDGHMIDMGDALGKVMAAIKALDARTMAQRGGVRRAA
jgi:hypothetical protein